MELRIEGETEHGFSKHVVSVSFDDKGWPKDRHSTEETKIDGKMLVIDLQALPAETRYLRLSVE